MKRVMVNKDTFTRSIPRKSAPVNAAGLGNCSSATVASWKEDEMKFAPYNATRKETMSRKGGLTLSLED